jgi:hypothetical protein
MAWKTSPCSICNKQIDVRNQNGICNGAYCRIKFRLTKDGDCLRYDVNKIKSKGERKHVLYKGKHESVYRVWYMLHKGPIPKDKPFILHHPSKCKFVDCCKLSHLRLGTAQENSNDRQIAGTLSVNVGAKNGQAKLTASNVKQIRKLLLKGVMQKQIAEKYGVSQTCIWEIKTLRKWAECK